MTVAFRNANTVANATSSPLSASMTVNAGGTNTAIVVCVVIDHTTGAAVSTVKYATVSLTSAGTPVVETGGPNGWIQTSMWYLFGPATGANTLAVTCTGTIADIYASLTAFDNVNSTTPVRAGTYNTANYTAGAGSPAITITSNTLDMAVAGLGSDNGSINSVNQTSDGINNNGNDALGAAHNATPASSVTFTWSTNNTHGALAGFSFNGDANTTSSDIWFGGHYFNLLDTGL